MKTEETAFFVTDPRSF